ncbi:UNVERIFIED_CONTAM: hypothetical protein PYX00_010838 [Menopon gallinae]|uniref:Reverse transcriptase domain-containing protein n=1 Tax=Menopon gallinae TaxID=328185 RepID=A0AAW2H6Y9_9NEOP
MDIKGAFDHAWWPTILRRLADSEAPNNLQRVVHNYFKDRRTFITGQEYEVKRTAERGCPQGSILGPIFWNIIMDTFLELNFPFSTRTIAYADDGLIIFSARSRAQLDSRAKTIGAILDAWVGSQKLEICGNKTVTLMLRGRHPDVCGSGLGAPHAAEDSKDGFFRGQRAALLLITKAFRTVSAEALQVVAGLMPIDLVLKMRAEMYQVRAGFSDETEMSVKMKYTE